MGCLHPTYTCALAPCCYPTPTPLCAAPLYMQRPSAVQNSGLTRNPVTGKVSRMNMMLNTRYIKIDRHFGRCTVKGCATRRVIDGKPYVGEGTSAVPIFYGGFNGPQLIAAGLFCTEHNKHLTWTQLQARTNPEKTCNGVCMGAVGGSCDCSCGGENHGKNHIG
ncbi:hypothetical protein AVV73_gp040 [Mycobacterium phage CaptainTrips]|uniref:Uncharacterized protein n=2 Tax=Cheoctovirus TaxID=1623281 RepID=A0A0A0RQ77_9CAUD|nr:hypothetical protein AVV73_gp040 [Mycobacterium phage CaptainTrips]AIW02432.1 hypothetical protein PBI_CAPTAINTRIPS_40 [Mycobacterium phage CaptainTrips]